jgi:hypothetical protein
MSAPDPDLISALRIELAALSRDMAHVQRELAEIRAVFSRLVWFLVIGLMGAVLRFTLEGGFNV